LVVKSSEILLFSRFFFFFFGWVDFFTFFSFFCFCFYDVIFVFFLFLFGDFLDNPSSVFLDGVRFEIKGVGMKGKSR